MARSKLAQVDRHIAQFDVLSSAFQDSLDLLLHFAVGLLRLRKTSDASKGVWNSVEDPCDAVDTCHVIESAISTASRS